jgi:lipopolysaccharide/colanic/teichoic acid biosynthesis glycosyltransferase
VIGQATVIEDRRYLTTKRLFDVAASAAGLVILAPVFAVVAVCIKICSPGPVLYGSTRIGCNGLRFEMWKFRSMVINADRMGASVTTDADPRVTAIGRILRRSKLDELPSLFNVLRGEMSLVGPRPETPQWIEFYTPEMRSVLNTRPGVTDVAQIIFRHEERMLKGDALDPKQYLALMRWKVALQQEYVAKRSFIVDIKVLVQTVMAIFDRIPDADLEQLVSTAGTIENCDLPDILRLRADNLVYRSSRRAGKISRSKVIWQGNRWEL